MVNSRNTARVAQPLPGDALYQRRARIVLPILVRIANANETIEYGELAKVAGMPNPRNLNYVLGCIGQTLIALSRSWDTEIPPIQCLVVSKGSGAPSEGIVEFFSGQRDYARLTRDQQREIMGVEQKRVFTFRKWPDVLADLGLGDGSQRFSAEDYMAALREVPLGPQHRRMLAAHHAAPDRTVTAAQLARAVGYSPVRPTGRTDLSETPLEPFSERKRRRHRAIREEARRVALDHASGGRTSARAAGLDRYGYHLLARGFSGRAALLRRQQALDQGRPARAEPDRA
jgi:hypothetical protein